MGPNQEVGVSHCAVNIFMVNLFLHSQSCQIQSTALDSTEKCKKSWKTLHSPPALESLDGTKDSAAVISII